MAEKSVLVSYLDSKNFLEKKDLEFLKVKLSLWS